MSRTVSHRYDTAQHVALGFYGEQAGSSKDLAVIHVRSSTIFEALGIL